MAKESSNVRIEGDASPCGDRTNEGDDVFQKVFERETGLSFDSPGKPNAPETERSVGETLRK